MSQLLALVEACETDTKKALRQGGKAIAGTLPSWSRLAKECLSNEWDAPQEKEMIRWAAEWAKKVQQHDPLAYAFWSVWPCTVNRELQMAGDPSRPFEPFATCSWNEINLAGYRRWIGGALGDTAIQDWLTASDEHKPDHLWWATPNAKLLLKNNTTALDWILENTFEAKVPLMAPVWRGLSAINESHGYDVGEAFSKIEFWSEKRARVGLEPLELGSLVLEQPVGFWSQVISGATPSKDTNVWISPWVDKQLAARMPKNPKKWIEKWEWLKTQSKWTKDLMHKPNALARMKAAWLPEWRDAWSMEIEKSALRHQKKQLLIGAAKQVPSAL